jgi:hypothetical protein
MQIGRPQTRLRQITLLRTELNQIGLNQTEPSQTKRSQTRPSETERSRAARAHKHTRPHLLPIDRQRIILRRLGPPRTLNISRLQGRSPGQLRSLALHPDRRPNMPNNLNMLHNMNMLRRHSTAINPARLTNRSLPSTLNRSIRSPTKWLAIDKVGASPQIGDAPFFIGEAVVRPTRFWT